MNQNCWSLKGLMKILNLYWKTLGVKKIGRARTLIGLSSENVFDKKKVKRISKMEEYEIRN